MHLEKVTSRSGHAALAGWISSNDVTLFTTVLVMAIALYLHARLTRGADENLQLTENNAALAASLDANAIELATSNELLDETRKTVTLVRSERDQLERQLLEKLEAIAQLNSRIDAILAEKAELESEHLSLQVAQEALSKESAELRTHRALLIDDQEKLKTNNATLRQRLDDIASQLERKIAALEQAEAQRDRLKNLTDELQAVVAGLNQRLNKLDIELDETQTSAETARSQWQRDVQDLTAQLDERDKSLEEYVAKLKQAMESLQGLTVEKRQLQQALSESELKRQAELLEEARHYREILGLTGRLDRVAILFDASGSMRQASANRSDRWIEAQEIAANWLQHLSVRQCVLIVFSSDVRTFPEDGSLADLQGENGQARRDALLQHLKTVSPGGATNTYGALAKAYQYGVDAILLFSDGAPSLQTTGVFDPAAAQQIYELCRSHPNVPVHTVGLGNYFDQNASNFLMSVAKITRGTFRGQ